MAQSPEGGGQQPSLFTSFFPMIFMIAVIYFLLFLPNRKKEKQHRAYLNNLQKGDEVITQSGIFGKVFGVTDQVVTLEISDQVKIKVLKSAIMGPQAKEPMRKSA